MSKGTNPSNIVTDNLTDIYIIEFIVLKVIIFLNLLLIYLLTIKNILLWIL